jgi:thiamine kinase-like enzyme
VIPESKTEVVTRALQSAFNTSEYESISELTAGLSSARIYKIMVKERPYLLRVIMRTDEMADPTYYFSCMKVAAEAGLAPRIWYTHAEDRISITDFIEAKPFPIKLARVLIPELLSRLHALPLFSMRINYLDFADRGIRRLQSSKWLPESMTQDIFINYEKFFAVYPRDVKGFVSCHNDLKPDNILFDGERVWLVDWEAVFPNDRYVDLAVVGNFVILNNEDEKEYLKSYFGEGLNAYHEARFFLMSQMMHLVYLSFFMSLYSADGKAADLSGPIPEYREFHNRVWKGEVHLLDKESQLQYALVHLDRAKNNLRTKRFEESLKIVSGFEPSL